MVNYLSKADAQSQKLATVNSAGQFVMKTDNTNTYASGAYRNSTRISSTAAYGFGSLIVVDVEEVAYGCSVWPAIWMVGPDWPSGGEVSSARPRATDIRHS